MGLLFPRTVYCVNIQTWQDMAWQIYSHQDDATPGTCVQPGKLQDSLLSALQVWGARWVCEVRVIRRSTIVNNRWGHFSCVVNIYIVRLRLDFMKDLLKYYIENIWNILCILKELLIVSIYNLSLHALGDGDWTHMMMMMMRARSVFSNDSFTRLRYKILNRLARTDTCHIEYDLLTTCTLADTTAPIWLNLTIF